MIRPRDNRQWWRELQITATDHGFAFVEVVQWKLDRFGVKCPTTGYVLYRVLAGGLKVRVGRRGSVEGAASMLRLAMRADAESRSAPR